MTRISLVETYDNRDVIAQIVRLRQDVNELQDILRDIDPNGDLTNVVTKTGDQTIDGIKTFIGKIVADCDIIQNGAAYETHAEQIYSHNDYLVMRDGALNGLAAGTYSGLQVKKYNGSDDVRMVVDNTGIMRVGDINDERPLLVRDEAADLSAGDILLWDSVNLKAIGQPKDTVPTSGSTAVVTSDGILTALNGKVSKTGIEQISGQKTFEEQIVRQLEYGRSEGPNYPWVLQIKDKNGVLIAGLRMVIVGDGSVSLYASAINQDGTFTDATIVSGV